MNERIRELAEEHGFIHEYMTIGERNDALTKYREFAELIVRQCGYYADVFESLGCPVDMDPTETKPSDYIKKHFGVQE